MRKKPTYTVNLTKDGMPYQMKLDYYYNGADRDKSGHEGWVFAYDGLILGSSWGTSVDVRDNLFKSVSTYLRNCFLSFNVLEKFEAICNIPPHKKEMTHYSDDEIWFHLKSQKWLGAKHKPSVPDWVHPKRSSSKGVPLNCYIALKKFMKRPENRKKTLIHRTAKKFGI